MIQLLDQNTIDQIAAGEVVERPSAVVKELVENAIDSGANAITIEIKEGGIALIRITDNGCGIAMNEIPMAFQRHATSKMTSIEDLLEIRSLGFRGEALSSIAAVSQVELVTKTAEDMIGCRYEIHGGTEIVKEQIGCPDGTTFLVRNLFYNTPARGKFLKSKTTEGGYVNDVVLHFTLSHPEIRFKFIMDGKTKIQTSGNGNLKDNIFHQFGSDVVKALLPVDVTMAGMHLTGFVGKPELSRGTRSFMNYYINGRHIKSPIVQKAIETAYHGYMMTGRFPFTSLFLEIDSACLDVNVHPTKMEVRFTNQEDVFTIFSQSLREVLRQATLIPEATPGKEEKKVTPQALHDTVRSMPEPKVVAPEPFEYQRLKQMEEKIEPTSVVKEEKKEHVYAQQSFFQQDLLAEEDKVRFRLIGQVFGTFWMIEYGDEMLIIDQHAAHEKVLYEEIIKEVKENQIYRQNLLTPIILSLTYREKEVLVRYQDAFAKLGFEIESFGGDEYAIKTVPSQFLHLATKELFYSMLDELLENPQSGKNDMITDRCATIACKAAVKGNHTLTFTEAETLIEKMLRADEPYHCPHGRPTTISMSKKEFEKKFKRIV